uniref:Nucleotidyltransferase-like domain-containing protein n=1 Tax=Desulfovibrio sp. U5L TaxID=596152 RepID=I2Q5E7_9BACT
MALVIKGILEESREYYRKIKRESVGRLLINPRGSLYRKDDGGTIFLYLRRMEHGTRRHVYIGKDQSDFSEVIERGLALHSKAVVAIREAKTAMRELGMPNQEIKAEDYFPVVRELFQTMADAGLWDEGVTLIGSWCFKIYQNYCGVEYFPERTLDVDFAIQLPYRGKKVNVGDMLKSMGFEEVINHADGTVFYRSGELSVEFLKDRVGDGRERGGVYEAEIGIAPVAVPYMRILLSNPMEIKARDLGRVVVPSIAAFFLHKLLVASERRKEDKRLKDYRQVEAVAKAILTDPAMVEDVKRIAGGLHKKWVKKLMTSAGKSEAMLDATGAVLRRAGIIEGG